MKTKIITLEKCITVLISLFILPILIEAFYNHPTADDYWYSNLTHDVLVNGGSFLEVIKAAINTSVEYMNSWQGLYSSAFVLALQPGIFTKTENLYFITTWFLVFLMIFSVVIFSREMFKILEIKDKVQFFLFALLVAFFIIETMPDSNQGLFWYNGAMNYMLFWMLLLINIALLINGLRSEKNNILKYIGISLLGFFIGGGNHLTAVLQVLFAILFLLFAFIKKKHIIGNGACFIVSVIGLIINLTAKGTQVRRNSLDYNGSMIKTIVLSVVQTNRLINGWIGVSLILLCVLCCMVCGRELVRLKEKGIFKWIYAIIGVVGSYGIICIMLCIPYYAMGTWGEGRLTNIVYASFVILFVMNFLYILGCLQCHFEFVIPEWMKMLVAVGAIVYIGIFGNVVMNSSTSIHAVLALCNGSAKQYDQEIDQRIQFINETEEKDVEVSKLSVYPHNLFFEDIDYNTENYKNKWMAEYFHKDSIKLTENEEGE